MPFVDIPFPLVLIVGPTAVGKTELSIRLAEKLDAEIISADSRLFYKGMDIGTAKPTIAERGRVPHHLIDVAEPDEIWSLAMFQEAAKKIIQEIQERGKLPILVGGTGQYVRSVTEGWSPPALEPDEKLREVLERWAEKIGPLALYDKLARLDAPAAKQIDYRNVRRTIRALEVIFKTGQRFSDQRQRLPSPYTILMIGLKRPRPELYARVDGRIEAMLAQGFQDEVRNLLAKGYSPDLPNLSAIGYREMIAVLQEKLSIEEAVVLIKRSTRQFVRRQANWFKEDDPTIHWFDAGTVTVEKLIDLIRCDQNWIRPAEGSDASSHTG
jgi:tRNA dimethylallyltransferase